MKLSGLINTLVVRYGLFVIPCIFPPLIKMAVVVVGPRGYVGNFEGVSL